MCLSEDGGKVRLQTKIDQVGTKWIEVAQPPLGQDLTILGTVFQEHRRAIVPVNQIPLGTCQQQLIDQRSTMQLHRQAAQEEHIDVVVLDDAIEFFGRSAHAQIVALIEGQVVHESVIEDRRLAVPQPGEERTELVLVEDVAAKRQ